MSRRAGNGGRIRYTIGDFGRMMACANRTDAYDAALRQAVTTESVVIDLGAGGGIFALLACKYGARRVYAIDPNDAIAVAEELGRACGFGDRLTCIQNLSSAIDLPERADVIVSDLRGMVPLFETHIPTIIDARQRLLKPGGVLIPRRDAIRVALVDAEQAYSELVDPWVDGRFELDLSKARRYVVNDTRTFEFEPQHLLTSAQRWVELDYRTIESPDAIGSVEWTTDVSGTSHGLALWFASELADEVGYETGPENIDGMHRCWWLSFDRPIELVAGESVVVQISAKLLDGDYIWRWKTKVFSRSGAVRAELDQSDFFGMPRGRETLRRGRAQHAPELRVEGAIDLAILKSMNGSTTIEQIAHGLTESYPRDFPTLEMALARVAALSQRYSK